MRDKAVTGAPYTTHPGLPVKARQIRALFDGETVRVYQAYANEIADAALAGAQKDPGQCRILAIDLKRVGFDWILRHAQLAHDAGPGAPSIVQWDPERDLDLRPLSYRSIQIGLRGEAVNRYVNEWITRLVDVTESAQSIHACLLERWRAPAAGLLPPEREYPFEKIAPGLFGA